MVPQRKCDHGEGDNNPDEYRGASWRLRHLTITPAADEFVSSFTDNGQSAPLTPAAGNTFTYSLSNVITSHSLAVSFMTPRNVTALAAGSMHTLALLDDGTVWAWGLNTDGQLGNGSTGLINSNPVQVKGLTGVTAIAAGGSNSLALKADGSVWTWGDNTHGQLGDGTTSDRNTPVQVPGMSGVISVRAGASHTIAVKGDGTVWVWGWNQHGQLGNGATTDCTSPVQLTALSGVTSVAAGAYHSLARKSDGTIWAWGNNSSGQIGDGTSGTSRLSPVQVSGLSNVVGLAAGRYHSTALKGDGTVWNWGWDYYGELGDGGSSNRVTPFQVPGLAGVTSLSTQNDFTVALKADGTIWGWGQNDSGELGNGSITHSTPVQAAQLAGVTSVAAGGYHTVVLKDDNTLWSWGYNGYGQLGDGTVVNKLTRSLVQGIGTPMPPVASVVGTPSSPTTQQTATLTVGGSGVVSYRFKLDAGDYSSEVPVGTPIALSSLADGTHIVAIIGKDNIGNWQSTATTTAWNVDTTPPTATITGTPASRTQATSATLTVGGTGVTYYRYKLDDGAYSADTSVYTNITLSNLSEASHAVAVIGKDSAGNWQVDPTTVTWTVDLTPPTAVIGGTPDNPTNAPGATLTISGTDVVSYKYKLDSGNYYGETAVATPIILSSLSDATHTVSVLGKDAAGNWQVTPTVVSWTVDRTPPTAVVTGAPPAQTNTTTATLNVGGSGVLSYKYKVYPDYTYSSEVPSTTAITLMGLSEGSYTVYVLGKDAAGNWQVNPTVVAWTVDLTPPTAGISGVPASLSNSAGATLTIWDVASYKYKLDSGSYSAETAVATPITLTSLSETTHTLSVLGKDAAGNWQLTPTVVSWTVDLTPPAAVISGTPAASTNSTSATLAISGTDVISYKYKLDTGSYSFERTAGTSITLTALSEATHTVSVLGKDSAGNWQVTPTTVSWTVDLTPPAAVISSTPANPTNATGATLGVSGTGVVSYKYKLDSGSYSVETAVATPITLSSLSEATHTVSVLGKDAAGNWQVTPTTVSWTVDRTPPTAVVTGAPPAQTNATNTSLNVGGSGVVSYKYMVSPDNTYSSEMPGATAITLLGLSEGSYTVSVLGKDAAGNWQVSPTVVAWTVDLTPPTAVITGTPAASTNSRIATLAVSGTDVVSYKYKLDTGSYSSELTAATPITLSALSEASHTISVLGKDIAGNWQVTPTIVFWTVDLTPPTAVIAGAPAAPTKSTGATLTVSGTGVISYKYKLDTGTYSPEIAVETPITVTSLGEGTHTVSVLGKDAAGNWQATATAVTWRVDLDITAIAAGSTHTLALLTDGTVWAWGSNFYGELGNGWWHNSYPAQVKGLSGVTAIAAGDSSSLALKADGTVWTWGYNSHGQLGDGTTSDRNTPVQVPGLTGVISIRAGAAHTIAVKGDGSVWVWGGNQYGQLGNGATTDCTSPVQLTALSGVTAVAAGGYYSLARKSDGTIWAWGDNGSGQLGDGTSGGSRLSPGLVPGLSDVVALAAGTGHSTALKGDGTVWNWGANYYGQLGDEGPSPRSTPFQVPGLAGVTSISAGGFSTIALKQDGTVWGWGSNDKGQLGNGAITNSIPVQAAQLSGVTSVAGGGSHTVALRGDNTLWSWGYNAYGEAGDGTTVDRLTRTLVKVIGTPITPLASIAGTPATLTTQTSATLTVGGSGVVSYRYQLDAGDYSPEAPVGTPITLSSLADGTHIVAVIGKDNIGNWQSTPTTTAWNVDSTPPAATLTGTPSSSTRATSATLTVGGAGVTYYRYKLDDGAYSADTYVYTNITLSNLSEGTHTVAVIGKDAAGNWQATPTEVSWKVDTSAPATTASPTGYIVVSGKVSLACSDGAGSGCVTTRYCLGTGCTPATTYSGPIPINATTDLRFYSTDAAGNSESVKTAGYTVLASDYAVTVTVSGSGTGSVTSNPAAISATGSASARFAAMATVTLQATPGPYSAFTGWTGACTGVGDCVLSVTADRAATATFAFDTFHSTNTGTGVYNSSIQAALNGSIDNDIIHLWRIEFFEDLIFSQDKKTTISGGYDQNYTAQSGSTILHGALKITNGTVKIDRLTLR